MSTAIASTAADDDTELTRLAALAPLSYEREREAAARSLDIRVSVLDRLVEERRPKCESGGVRSIRFATVEPWPTPVRCAELLTRLSATIRKHIILSASAADCTALWIAHTWVFDRFQYTPRLAISSPVKRCGKSTMLEVLRLTGKHTLKADSITASGIFRTVEELRAEGGLTLLVDEVDSFLGNNEELRGVLNGGFERTGKVIRIMELHGELRPAQFGTFCPVALSGIGKLPDTLADRSVPITLQRKSRSETVTKLRAPGARAALHEAARRLARWSSDHGDELSPDPEVPEAMGDREGDISIPLLAIADHAGGEWPERARRALREVFGVRNATEANAEVGALLLADIRDLFLGKGATRLPSADIVNHLNSLEERPWPEWHQGKPLTASQLAKALAPFRVRPTTIRPPGGIPTKGYYREAFEEAWERYLPPAGPSSTD